MADENRPRSSTAGGWLNTLRRADRVPTLTRASLALVCALLAGFITHQKNLLEPTPRDLEQVWFAARSILVGVNPYPLVGPGRALDWPFPLLYPLPAAVIAIPFAPLPIGVATVLFSALGGFALAWALMEYGYGPLFGFFSMPVRAACEGVQWSPVFAAAAILPSLSLLFVAKPTVGAAIFFARPSRWAFVGAAVFGGIAFLMQPTWVGYWLDAIARNNAHWAPTVPYRAPVTFVGGPLVLLALLRWRRPEARLVAAMVCVPQTLVLYDVVPLFLVPRTFWQAAGLVAVSHLGHFWVRAHLPPGYHESLNYAMVGQAMIWSLFLPCTLLVLCRPNEGNVSPLLERVVARWPAWLRGMPVMAASTARSS